MKRRNKNRKPHAHNRNPYTVMSEDQLYHPARLCRGSDRLSGFRTLAPAKRKRAVATYQAGFDDFALRQAERAQRTIRIERRDRGA